MSPTDQPASLASIQTAISEIRRGSAERELRLESPVTQLEQLLQTGIGALRVPVDFGGAGSTVRALAEVLITLASADSNLTQILRGHFGLVEILRHSAPTELASRLFRAAAAGEQFGPAGAERLTPDLATLDTELAQIDGELRLTGRKYYTTGSRYADELNVLVRVDGEFVSAIVPADAPGVTILDDWNGFGQRLTASGTAIFEGVKVDPGNLIRHTDPLVNNYMEAFYQFVHSATQAGIAQAIADDAARTVRGRTRSYPLAPSTDPTADPQVLQVVGEAQARAFAARATVFLVADSLDAFTANPCITNADRAVLDSSAAQVIVTRLVGESSWQLFDAASASAIDTELNLHRHWRNARTVSSHNPAQYKATQLGRYAVTGEGPRSFLNSRTAVKTPERNGI